MSDSFLDKIHRRQPGICVYGLAPPKRTTPSERIAQIAARQRDRINGLDVDGVVVYDIQDEAGRTEQARPFPFLPTIDPQHYADTHLGDVAAQKIVYRSVGADTDEQFTAWAGGRGAGPVVLVGSASRDASVQLHLSRAYELVQRSAPDLVVGGIAIAERHARRGDEHERLLAKMRAGCRFFVTQAVYDVTATKSLLSDYALAVADNAITPVPLIITFSPCASTRTLAFMKWLGISFPRWLDNELTHASDALATSLKLCTSIFDEIWDFAHDKQLPVGINIESVSIRKAEIDASVELFETLRARMSL